MRRMKLNTKMSMKMKLKLKSKFKKKSKAKPSPCSSERGLRKRDVFANVLRFFRKLKGCVIPREGVSEPGKASTKNSLMVEHLIELDLPFAKLDDETFLEYLNELFVNKSTEMHSGIQDRESSEILRLSSNFLNLTPETFVETLEDTVGEEHISVKLLELLEVSLNQTPEEPVETKEFLQIPTQKLEMTSLEILSLVGATLALNPELEPAEILEFYNILEQETELVAVETIKPLDISLDQTPLESEETLESSEVSPLEQEPELVAVETIEPLDVSLDQTPLESEETLESSEVSPLEQEPELVAVETIEPLDISLDQTPLESEETLESSEVSPLEQEPELVAVETIEPLDVSLDQTPLESEKPLESSGVEFGCSTDNVEEEGCSSKMSEQKDKDKMMNKTVYNEGRSLESMTFNSLMTFSTLESSEAMKINNAEESGSSQTSLRPNGLGNSSIGLRNDDALSKTLLDGQSLCSPKLEARCGNPACNGLTKDMFSGFQGIISLKLEECCEGKVACKKPNSLTSNISPSSSTPKEEVTNTKGTNRNSGTKKRANRRRGKGKSNKTVVNDGKQNNPTGAKVTSGSPRIKDSESEIQTKMVDTKLEVPDVEVPDVEVPEVEASKIEAPKGENPKGEEEANISEAPKVEVLRLETSPKSVAIKTTSLNIHKVYPEQLKKLFDKQVAEKMASDPSKKWITPKNRKRNHKNKNNNSSSRGSSFNHQIARIVDEDRGYSKEIPHKISPKDTVAISDGKKQAALLPNFTPFEHPEDKEFFDFSTLLTDKEFLAKTNFNWADDPSIEDIL